MANHKRKVMQFRCYARLGMNGDKQGYYAVCIDLNLFTWRPTFAQAKKSLNDAIEGYLETVCELSKEEKLTFEDVEKRVLRPAPFWPYKAQYHLHHFLNSLKKDPQTTFNENVNLSHLCTAA